VWILFLIFKYKDKRKDIMKEVRNLEKMLAEVGLFPIETLSTDNGGKIIEDMIYKGYGRLVISNPEEDNKYFEDMNDLVKRKKSGKLTEDEKEIMYTT